VLSVPVIEKKGYEVLFQDGHALIMSIGSSSDTIVVLGVESNLYTLKCQPMRAIESNSKVAEDKEQVAPKVEQLKGSQISGLGRREESSKTVKKVSWVEMTMQDANKWEASRSRVFSKKDPSYTLAIASVSEGVVVVVDPVWEVEPHWIQCGR
jgi:hypothetical protein